MKEITTSIEAVADVIMSSLEELDGMQTSTVVTAWMHVTAFMVSTWMSKELGDEWLVLLGKYVDDARERFAEEDEDEDA